ncbi:MAG: serpin family protein [Clostridia bacterium]|nr:serpin family protein [Clostridia bacterium]
MRAEPLQNAIGMIDADLVERSEKTMKKKKRMKFTAVIAAVLVCAVGIGIFFGNQSPFVLSLHAISSAEYPKMEKYPAGIYLFNRNAWISDQKKQHAYFGAGEGLDGFICATASEILSGDGTENRVYSPMSIYMALAMLAEVSDGNTRAQILHLLGTENMEALRVQANAVWNANYNDDGAVTSILANSLWLDSELPYNKDTLELLAENYFASSYQGKMGSDSMNRALRAWLSEQTGNNLKKQTEKISFDPQTVLGLASTLYFRAKWSDEFSKSKTEKEIFHGTNGDVTVPFMKKAIRNGRYYWGEKFSASSCHLEGSGRMIWILPDENISPEMLLQDEEALRFISSAGNAQGAWENKKDLKVNLSVPKFDVSFQTDLCENLKNLGVTDCFSDVLADFSPLWKESAETDPLAVGEMQHGTRVTIDEEGVTGMSYTVIEIGATSAAPPDDEVDFTVDRPFLFVITGEDGSVLFIGVVNRL